ncbi:beta-propeller domain-containing protein [Candidatus Woesearchaeota archaeon]|nr:beta-propeller domain-containing protein [Candidatus Woesearchaeota archaeon]
MKITNIILSLILLVSLVGCATDEVLPTGFDAKKDVGAKTFNSEDELINFLEENSQENYYFTNTRSLGGEVLEMEDSAKTIASSANIDFSETNNQVQNVDEGDIIKTDGEYIYTSTSNVLYIVKSYPAEESEIISTIEAPDNINGLFINGDKLVVFGTLYDRDHFEELNILPRQSMSFFMIYDISDKEKPILIDEMKFEGYYFRSRMIDDNIYFITNSHQQRDYPMPIIFRNNEELKIAPDDIYYYDYNYNNPVYVNINAFNLDTLELESKSIIVESSQNMYMSENNIYLTYTKYVNEYELERKAVMQASKGYLTTEDNVLISEIKSIDSSILSQNEKESKVYRVFQDRISKLDRDTQKLIEKDSKKILKAKLDEIKHFEYTVINKINVDELDITPKSSGKVYGHTMNQFSLDENNDVLRIATTTNGRWDRFTNNRTESENHIFTLNESLEIIDSVSGIAQDERIYSTRFIEDKLYMVTFRQVDPFFVVDLSNPEEIEILGELKIPGFSRYLHPYDENHIIGIGRDANEDGRQLGLKISLFDVTDVSNPKEVAKYVSKDKYSSSTAEYEHKAFLFSKEKEMLVMPVRSYTAPRYSGAFVFKINEDEIELRGLIDHSKYGQYTFVERSLYIEDNLYTKSPEVLRINKIDDLEGIKDIKFFPDNVKVY